MIGANGAPIEPRRQLGAATAGCCLPSCAAAAMTAPSLRNRLSPNVLDRCRVRHSMRCRPIHDSNPRRRDRNGGEDDGDGARSAQGQNQTVMNFRTASATMRDTSCSQSSTDQSDPISATHSKKASSPAGVVGSVKSKASRVSSISETVASRAAFARLNPFCSPQIRASFRRAALSSKSFFACSISISHYFFSRESCMAVSNGMPLSTRADSDHV